MALPKLYDRITWHNNTTPALNEDNLNAMSQALDDIDDRVIDLAGTIMEDVPQIIEDMATIEAGLETVGQAVTDAQTSASEATAEKLKSEGFAVGEQNGVPVDSSSPYYHNNAKYYSQVAPPTAAAHVSYDNSQSHLAATNVQGAVDELKEALTDEAETRAKLGAHNLTLPLKSATSESFGVTIATDSDGVTSVSGTAIANGGRLVYCSNPFTLKKGTYIMSKGASDTTTSFRICIQDEPNKSARLAEVGSSDSELEFTLASDTLVSLGLNLDVNVTFPANFTIKPMIRLASDSDDTYQPYAPTNLQLENNKANKSDLTSISITGTTNSTGATIKLGTYFYLNGTLVRARQDISSGATFTKNTNYTEITDGGLNELGGVKMYYANYGNSSLAVGVNQFDIPTAIQSKYIIGALGRIAGYLLPKPPYDNSGTFYQSWGIGMRIDGTKLEIASPDTWSGLLTIVYFYID